MRLPRKESHPYGEELGKEVGNRKKELCVKDDCADGAAVRQKPRGKGAGPARARVDAPKQGQPQKWVELGNPNLIPDGSDAYQKSRIDRFRGCLNSLEGSGTVYC